MFIGENQPTKYFRYIKNIHGQQPKLCVEVKKSLQSCAKQLSFYQHFIHNGKHFEIDLLFPKERRLWLGDNNFPCCLK
jgi:hypothetical protein